MKQRIQAELLSLNNLNYTYPAIAADFIKVLESLEEFAPK
jgi:hypothetical protein